MTSVSDIFERTFRKFETRAPLTEADRQAFLSLPFETKVYEPQRYIVRQGDRAPSANLIVEGLAFRQKVTVEGARQILSLQVSGDFVDLEGSLLSVADHNVQALTRCEVAAIPRAAVLDLIDNHARLARAMWIDTLVDASIYREWILNVGRRDAYSALCHFLCEVARRFELAGLADRGDFELPATQEQLADVLGMTPVHINRTLRQLDQEGLIIREKRSVRVPDWEKLRKAAGFNELYLHVDQVAADARRVAVAPPSPR